MTEGNNMIIIKLTWIPTIKTQKIQKCSTQEYQFSAPRKIIFEGINLWDMARETLSKSGKDTHVNFVFRDLLHNSNISIFCGDNPSNDWKLWPRKNENEIILNAIEWE
jgi:hypothetical protein